MKFTFAPESKPLEGYTIKRAIERGGFGEVYYALSDAGKEVALKLVQQNMDIELRGVSQCLNLKHPNLVTIFDIRTDADGDHWVVMEYVSGKNLNKVVSSHPNGMPIEEIQRWLSGIVAGASFLHDRGIVHRDLKPANIYAENGVVKIGDVGLSKFISPSRRSAHTQSVGTVYYMAPEVARGRYGREVDVYSLAVILYEMLTGRVPFDGETTAEILMKHLTQKPDLSPLPARMRPVLARALEKDPQKRTPSLKVLKQDFENAVLGLDVALEIPEESFTAATADTDSPPDGDTATDQSDRSRSTKFPPHQHRRPVVTRNVESHGEVPWHAHSPTWFHFVLLFGFVLFIVSPASGLARVLLGFGVIATLGCGAFRLCRHLCNSALGYRHLDRRDIPEDLAADVHTNRRVTVPHAHGSRARPAQHWVRHRYRSAALTPETRRTISLRQRLTELTGSMAFASLCTVVITAGLYCLTSFFNSAGAVGLFATTTLLGSWAVLVGSKIWEGRKADAFGRRLTLLVLAGLVGAAAYWLDGSLMVELVPSQSERTHGIFTHLGPQPLFDADSEPTLAGYLAFFCSLFFLRRWWWHADAFRPKRLRVMSLLLTLLLGYLMSTIWGFPVSWSMIWAIAISSVVQLSSVWVPREDRHDYMEGGSHAI